VHDCALATTTSLGWRSFAAPVSRGGLVAFRISEYANGQQDLTGDVDTNDTLVCVVPSTGGAPIVLRLEGWFFDMSAHQDLDGTARPAPTCRSSSTSRSRSAR